MNWENLMWLTLAALCASFVVMLPSIYRRRIDKRLKSSLAGKPILKWAHHLVIWVFGLCAAPFSSGGSLIMVPIAYLAIALDRDRRGEI